MTKSIFDMNHIWIAIGLIGQLSFSARFLIQWLASEKVKKSIIPDTFWYFSMGGGCILLMYAIHRRDPVFILGQATGVFIYARNIYFVWTHRKKLENK